MGFKIDVDRIKNSNYQFTNKQKAKFKHYFSEKTKESNDNEMVFIPDMDFGEFKEKLSK